MYMLGMGKQVGDRTYWGCVHRVGIGHVGEVRGVHGVMIGLVGDGYTWW